MMCLARIVTLGLVFSQALVVGCAKKKFEEAGSCVMEAPNLSASIGSTGIANVFNPDPIVGSQNPLLSPYSSQLDSYVTRGVFLEHLGGRGVLEGQYVDVRNGVSCGAGFGAYSDRNDFSYSHSQPGFQEAMVYYFGDRYRSFLDGANILEPKGAVQIIAHCMQEDNAFFVRDTQSSFEAVCLGDSAKTPGASYSDDAVVTIHELQHATTVDTYSKKDELNQLYYDEAGALNEAISDFMSLMYFAPDVFGLSAIVDPRVFSRWALGTFMDRSAERGAHRCPKYDPRYPNCTGYPAFSADKNWVSYIYPDGTGWPYANNFAGPGYLNSIFNNYGSQEEIHNSGILMSGALWDAYEGIRANHAGDELGAQRLIAKAVMETVARLDKPTPGIRYSPVTFMGFAATLVSAVGSSGLAFSAADQSAITKAMSDRGLYSAPTLSAGWASVGTGTAVSPGVRIEDDTLVLRPWLYNMHASSSILSQDVTTSLNAQLDPGEVAAIWLDVKNTADMTVGGVKVSVTSLSPEVMFIDFDTQQGSGGSIGSYPYEYGLVPQMDVMYGKINGNSIVTALSSSNSAYHVPAANSYFKTNPFFDHTWRTAAFVKVASNAAHGTIAKFKVTVTPSNGASTVIDASIQPGFQAKIN